MKTLVVVGLALVFFVSVGLFAKASNDCEAKHGHLAKDAYTGIYKCYGEEKK